MTIYTFYARGEPGLCYLFEALAAHAPMRNYWPAEWVDLARLAIGRAHLDPNRPTPLPIEWKPLAEHGARIGRKAAPGDTVIFTRPNHVELLPSFARQRKVYYVLDDYRTYNRNWLAEDEAMLRACDHVIAVSPALGELLETRVPGVASRLTVSANAVPASWIPASCPSGPAVIPGFQKGGPLVGVIGTISSRLRIGWIYEAVERTPGLNWLFVGSVEEPELLPEDRITLDKLERHPRCYFTGPRRYEQLRTYVRALDIALMPYSERSTNPYGSAMRLFMHLPFGQPIIATYGCKMVEDFQPLVAMAANTDELVAHLNRSTLDDGLRAARWQESRRHTWTARAASLLPVLLG